MICIKSIIEQLQNEKHDGTLKMKIKFPTKFEIIIEKMFELFLIVSKSLL